MTAEDRCRGAWEYVIEGGYFRCSCCAARAPRVLVERWAEDTPHVVATAARFYAWQSVEAESRAMERRHD